MVGNHGLLVHFRFYYKIGSRSPLVLSDLMRVDSGETPFPLGFWFDGKHPDRIVELRTNLYEHSVILVLSVLFKIFSAMLLQTPTKEMSNFKFL